MIVLLRPIVTEKSSLGNARGLYSFVVDKRANKLQIKKAVESRYSVSVLGVNTLMRPAKKRRRYTKRGLVVGTKSSYKKAIVKLSDKDSIDFYSES